MLSLYDFGVAKIAGRSGDVGVRYPVRVPAPALVSVPAPVPEPAPVPVPVPAPVWSAERREWLTQACRRAARHVCDRARKSRGSVHHMRTHVQAEALLTARKRSAEARRRDARRRDGGARRRGGGAEGAKECTIFGQRPIGVPYFAEEIRGGARRDGAITRSGRGRDGVPY